MEVVTYGSRDEAVGLVSELANTAAMNAHPVAIGAAVAPGSVGVVAPDGAGWHVSRKLELPDNIVLLKLPLLRPELHPKETVFRYPGAQPPDKPGVCGCRGGGWRLSRGVGMVRRRPEPHRLDHAPRVGNRPHRRPNQP